MINKIKNRFYFLENLWKQTLSNQDLLNRNAEDKLAMIQLLKMFSQEMFFPLTKWSLSPKEILHVCNDIMINKRKMIVEFGGGFSTICIAQLIKIKNLDATLYCVEDNQSWVIELQKFISENNLSNNVKIIFAPLLNIPSEFAKENQQTWYDIKVLNRTLNEINSVDLILVDGPFGKSTPFARFSAVPYLKNKLAENYSIYIDDTYREEESKIVKHWEQLLNEKAIDFKRYSVIQTAESFDVTPFSNF